MNENIANKVTKFVAGDKEEILRHRRWFHQHPETSFKEFKTSEYIQQHLRELDLTSLKVEAGTGIICEMGHGGLTHAARFNMDALPIPERSGFRFSSLYEGYSHACGHDFELAWGLSVARYFQLCPPAGTLRLIFQPAEEGPGEQSHGKTGGQVLAESGAFDVDSVMSLHVEPEVPIGTVSIADGEVTCSAYDFTFVLQGKTCHAGKPHQGINPVPIAASLVNDVYRLQEALRSEIRGDEGFVLISMTNFSTRLQKDIPDQEESLNTIPEYALIKGISRVRSGPVKYALERGLRELAAKYDALLQHCTLHLRQVAVATLNDSRCTRNVVDTAACHAMHTIAQRTTWRDDAGWASARAPSAHGFIGIADGTPIALHTPEFNPNEDALAIGLTIFIGTLERNFRHFNK